MKRWIALAVALAVPTLGLAVSFGTPAQAAECSSQSAAVEADPNTSTDPSPGMDQSPNSAPSPAQAAECSSQSAAAEADPNTSTDPSPGMDQSQDSEPPRQAPATDAATDASAARKPTPSDGYRPLILLHGFSPTGSVNCNNYWGKGYVEKYLNDTRGWAGRVRELTYYQSGGTGCTRIPGAAGVNQPIEDLGSEFAWYIYNTYSHSGVAVDVIAHSMGGLVTRIAIEGTQHRFMTGSGRTFPPYLYIEDVATLSSPHEGARSSVWGGCGVGYMEVCEMIPGSSFLRYWIAPYGNPQSTMGTDWSFIGSGDDWVVNTGSALDRNASRHPGHKYLYLSHTGLDHDQMANIGENGRGWKYPILYCHYNASCDMSGWESGTWFKYKDGKGAGPLWVAANAVFYHSSW
jgi:Putative serine esterase (DUF676)